MLRFRKPIDSPRRVWRITPEAPLGEFVSSAVAAADKAARALIDIGDEPKAAPWSRSSYDLLNGVEVTESGPGDFDAIFSEPGPLATDGPRSSGTTEIGRDQWVLRFALQYAELDAQAEPRDVIVLAKTIWPMKHFIAPDEAARSEHRWGTKARSGW